MPEWRVVTTTTTDNTQAATAPFSGRVDVYFGGQLMWSNQQQLYAGQIWSTQPATALGQTNAWNPWWSDQSWRWANWGGNPPGRADYFPEPPDGMQHDPTEPIFRAAAPAIISVRHDDERAAAVARARELLLSMLDPAQRIEFAAHGHFTVRGRERAYRITRGRVGNIVVLGGGQPLHRLCVHPYEAMPVEDVMLAQLMCLRDDEDAVLRVANVHPIGPQ